MLLEEIRLLVIIFCDTMFFKKKKRKSILDSKKYKMGRPVRYRNPLRIKRNIFKFKIFKVVNIFLLIGIFISIYFFIFSSFYQINNIEVFGNEIISTDDILDIVDQTLNKKYLLVLKNENIFIFNRKHLKEKIEEKIVLESIKIEKILPNTIRLTIKEKDAILKWVTNNQEYLLDVNGLIIKRFYKESIPDIFRLAEIQQNQTNLDEKDRLIVINLANQNVNLGEQVLQPEHIRFIIKLIEKLSEINYLSVRYIAVPNNFPKYIEIGINPDWKIFFNLADSVDSQINRLAVLIKEKIKENNISRLEYIDLRLGESIYYK